MALITTHPNAGHSGGDSVVISIYTLPLPPHPYPLPPFLSLTVLWTLSTMFIYLHLFSVVCILTKFLSHASEKKKTEGLRVSNVALLLVILKWHHSSERVKCCSCINHIYSVCGTSIYMCVCVCVCICVCVCVCICICVCVFVCV